MRCVQVLSALALKRLLSQLPEPVGSNGTHAARRDLPAQSSHHVARALRQANARAWVAVEAFLAGETLWERAQLVWQRELETEFFQPLRKFLDGASFDDLEQNSSESRRTARQALQAVLNNGLLTTGSLDLHELLTEADNVESRLDEWQFLGRLADELTQAGYEALRPLFELHCGMEEPLLVVLVTAMFRHAVRTDPDLFGELAEACAGDAGNATLNEMQALAAALDKHRSLLDSLLREDRQPGVGPALSPAVDTNAGAIRFQRGVNCAQRGDYEQAIGEFTSSLQLDPASAQTHVHRGDVHRLKGDYAQALADYSTAIKLDPANALALFNRGQVHWLMTHVREAVADFSAALEIDPNNAAAYHCRGKAHAAAGDLDAAIINFSETLRIDPYHSWAFHDCGDAYASKQNFDLAIANYSEAIRLNPLATLTYLRRAEAYAARKEFERAIADFGNVLRLDPHNVGGHLGRGAAYREQGMFDHAAADFTRALELDFSSPGLYFQRGWLFQMQGNHERALLDFDAAVELNGDDSEVRYRRGLTHQALGHEDEAIADLSQALRQNPNHAEAYHERGVLYAARGEAELAMADYSEAIRLKPKFAPALVNRARTCIKIADLDQAIADCEQALELDENFTQAYVVRGSVLAQQGRFNDAVEDFSRALRLDVTSPQAYLLRGVAQAKLDNRPLAVADLTEAIRLDPQNSRAFAQRAAVRKSAGQHDMALDDLAHAARIDTAQMVSYCMQLGLVHATRGNFERAVADYTMVLMLDPLNADAITAREQAWKAYLSRPRKSAPPPRRVPNFTDARPSDSLDAAEARTPLPSAPESAKTPIPAAPPAGEKTPVPAAAPIDKTPVPDSPTASEKTPVPAAPVSDKTPVPAPAGSEKASVQETSFEMSLPPEEAGPSHDETAPRRTRETDIRQLVDETQAKTPAGNGATRVAVPKQVKPKAAKTAEMAPLVTKSDDEVSVSDEAELDSSIGTSEEEAEQEYLREQALVAEKERNAAEKLAEEQRRVQMVKDFRRAEEQRQKQSSKKAKVAKKVSYDDDDYSGRVPLWKKSMIAAATIFLLWWTGSAAWGWIFSPVRMAQPRVAISGKAVLEKTGAPLTGAWVSFYPKDGGDWATGMVDKDGHFKSNAFPGTYVVTVGPDPEGGAMTVSDSEAILEIPSAYKAMQTSPLTVQVSRNEKQFEIKVK